jgi:Kef-type K+ transport system membrane component KefB
MTVLANLGKMFPLFCYRQEVSWRERLALTIGLGPQDEVGAGILILALGYGLGRPMMIVAILSLALNMVLTGTFIWLVKRLMWYVPLVAPLMAPPLHVARSTKVQKKV